MPEYNPEQFGITGMSPGYLQSLMDDIKRRGDVSRGKATARGTAAGMQYDDPSVAIARQGAISSTEREKGSTVGGLAYQSWQIQQEQLEREKDRQLQLQLGRMSGGGGGYKPPSYSGNLPYTQPTSMTATPGGGAGMGVAPTGTGVSIPQAPAARRASEVEEAYGYHPRY